MVQVDLGATSPSGLRSRRSMTSRVAIPMAASPLPPDRSPPAAFRLSTFQESKMPQRSPRLLKRRREWKPKRAFHRAEKLKACCVNNEAESIGTSGGSFSMFAHRNTVLSLSWQIYKMSCLREIDPDLMADFFFHGAEVALFTAARKIEGA